MSQSLSCSHYARYLRLEVPIIAGVSMSNVSSRLLGPGGTEMGGEYGGFGVRCMTPEKKENTRQNMVFVVRLLIITTMNVEYQTAKVG